MFVGERTSKKKEDTRPASSKGGELGKEEMSNAANGTFEGGAKKLHKHQKRIRRFFITRDIIKRLVGLSQVKEMQKKTAKRGGKFQTTGLRWRSA